MRELTDLGTDFTEDPDKRGLPTLGDRFKRIIVQKRIDLLKRMCSPFLFLLIALTPPSPVWQEEAVGFNILPIGLV